MSQFNLFSFDANGLIDYIDTHVFSFFALFLVNTIDTILCHPHLTPTLSSVGVTRTLCVFFKGEIMYMKDEDDQLRCFVFEEECD